MTHSRIEKVRYAVQEIIAEYSTIINMTFVQFVTAFYNHYSKPPDMLDLIRFFPLLTIEEIIVGKDAITYQWRNEI